MNVDKKPAIEKRYAIPSKDSIKAIAESVGHELDEETVSLLCEDVSYRLRQVVQSSGKFMRHAKRRKLTTEDVNRALSFADIQPVYGQDSGETAHFHHIKEADVYVNDDPEISLLDVAFRDELVCHPGETSIKAHWLAVEGQHRTSTQKPTERKVSDDLLVYYDQMAKALLSNDRELMRAALVDLRTNSKILPVFPYFVNFVASGVAKVNHDINQLMRLLQTVQALMCNDSLYMQPRPYLATLVKAVLYCVTEPLAASLNPLNDHWRLRDYAARLLAQIVHKWSDAINQLLFKNSQALKEVLISQDKAVCSHYGAVVGLTALGIPTLEKILLPYLPTYLANRLMRLTAHDHNSRMEWFKVDGAVVRACRMILRQAPDPSRTSGLAKLYTDLYEHYGDSLCCRLGQEHSAMILLAKKAEPPIVLHEPLRSGEEMLAEFMEMVKRDLPHGQEDSKSEQTDRSQNDDDVDSPASFKSDRSERSEFDEKPEYSHLAVKSTVNDPNLGIKLTITKKPMKKAKKRRIKYKVQDVFEKVNFERYHPFVFNVPRLVKWHSKAASKDFSLDFNVTKDSNEFRRLFQTHPPLWTASKRIKKKPYVAICTGSMLVSL